MLSKLPPFVNWILFEDNHLLVVDKPAGIATMGSQIGEPTVARYAGEYLQRKYNKPGAAFVGIVSRLDARVSGVLVLARTSKAASRLSEQIRLQTVDKIYVAVVEGGWPVDLRWRERIDFVAKQESSRRMAVVSESYPGAQLARLRMRVLASQAEMSLVQIQLLTGRKHQIRLQLSEFGHPILGDTKYGASRKFGYGIALHCQKLGFIHPTLKEKMTFTVSAAKHWPRVPQTLLQPMAGIDGLDK